MIALYIKTHRKTGLKYLGKTNQDPFEYQGSGVRWSRHIAKHGYDVDTEVVRWCIDNDAVRSWGIFYSDLFNVVDDPKWANLKREQGDGGWDHLENSPLLKKEKNRRARKTTDAILEDRWGDEWRSKLGKIANEKAKEKKTGIYADDFIPAWRSNKALQQLGNSPEARAKAKVTQKKTFAKIDHQQGEKNSQYGSRWVSDGKFNMKLPSDVNTPVGWQEKRVMGLPSIDKELKELLIEVAPRLGRGDHFIAGWRNSNSRVS